MNSIPLAPDQWHHLPMGQPQKALLNSFSKPIDPIQTSATYRLAIFAVAVVMIILPLVYLAIIGLVGYGVYYHAVHHVGMLEAARGRGAIFVFLLYVTPMIAGAFLFLFMLKPIFSRQGSAGKKRTVTADESLCCSPSSTKSAKRFTHRNRNASTLMLK